MVNVASRLCCSGVVPIDSECLVRDRQTVPPAGVYVPYGGIRRGE